LPDKGFAACLLRQARRYPALAPRDALKLCFQAAYGPEHLLADRDQARAFLLEELKSLAAAPGPLIEAIGPHYARVNLAPWKHQGLDPDILWQAFCQSAATAGPEAPARLCLYHRATGEAARAGALPFGARLWDSALSDYLARGGGPLRHSPGYRQAHQPHYRVVAERFCRALTPGV